MGRKRQIKVYLKNGIVIDQYKKSYKMKEIKKDNLTDKLQFIFMN